MSQQPAHTGETWLDQWHRVNRWHGRLDPIRLAVPDEDDPNKPQALDEVFAFFMNCYHLRDWLIGSGEKSRDEVDEYINGNEALALCRDVCNGLKHHRLDPGRRHAHAQLHASPVWSTTSFTLTSAWVPNFWGNLWVFTETPRGNWDMFELADQCVEAWRRFLALSDGPAPAAGK